MANFRELLSTAKSTITEVSTEEAGNLLADEWILLDVREPDEFAQGAIKNSKHIPRGNLESSIEMQVPDKGTKIVVMCAGGARSAFATKTLLAMDYKNVVSMDGGFNQWKDESRIWEIPKVLDQDKRNRYQRHLLLPEVGEMGQLKLLNSRVLCLGAGGLGSPVALYLAAAGVGTLGIVDMDVVDESNLQRQVLHNYSRIGQLKVDSAKKTISELNPDINVITHGVRLDASNMEEIISQYDVVVDGTDNFPVRYMLNDASVKLGIPVVHGSIFRFEGQITVFDPRNGPTYRDMVPEPPPPELAPSCAEAGVLGVLPGVIGCLQALETVKLILELGETLVGRLLTFDATEMSFREFKLRRDPSLEITWENRDLIQVVELKDSCRPAELLHGRSAN
ncbi:MAG: molybdopterin biosynthesis protein MoeB [Acidimicrobiaceae bacterium]|jgi:molybdopterin/thiamine biosynthesis adenylyltransferase/rhodanese-related sulfurtransferase|nr:molybdopterin biosynthesis protein MoeB [Acidimicrobiaceae bacterium]|tara:strand:+ start:18001 stop:19182 length:1182 start_codon:yes stop_codon:yes gene_type:complete